MLSETSCGGGQVRRRLVLASILVAVLGSAGCGGGGRTAGGGLPGTTEPELSAVPGPALQTSSTAGTAPGAGPAPAGPASLSGAGDASRDGWALVHWNVKSGFGQGGWLGSCPFEPGSDRARNAWGSGAMKATLLRLVGRHPEVAAVTLNEAWTSATPKRIRRLLGWRDVYGGAGGLGIVARYGFAGACETVELPRCGGDAERRWVVACPVYTGRSRRASATVYATHWTGCKAEGRATAKLLRRGAGVRVLAGDLNEKRPDSPAFAPILSAGYADAWRVLEGRGGATGTWNRQYGKPRGNLYKRIDYVFARGAAPVRITRFNHRGTPGACKESDHAGLIVRFGGSGS